ncbi:MAG: O-antigen ligase family protein [Candidatus Aminicenantes bacterium]|nr:O-antigen ligase family protein [Candidatus Aminicenantes bacterium]
MKQLFDISNNTFFYLALGFLFLIDFSIAGCYIIFTLLAIELVIYYLSSPRSQWPELPGYYKYFLLYLLFSLVSTAFAIDKLKSLNDNKDFFIYLLIPFFLLVLNTRKRLENSLFIVLMAAVVSSLLGIITVLIEGISLDHRLRGLTSHWMTYSGLLMIPFIFFFVYLFYEKRKKIKLLIAAALVPILAAILLSLTRSAWVGIFIALGAFIVYYKPKILYAAVPAAIILAFILPGSVTSRIVSIFDIHNETNKDRLYMVEVAVKIFKEYPLTGVGADNVGEIYDRYKPPEAALSNPHLHNNFLQELAERGIFALLSLVAAFVFIFILLVKKIKSSGDFEKAVAVGVFFTLIGFLIAGLFEYNFGDSELKFLLFYFLSIPFLKLAAASQASQEPTPMAKGE